MRITSTRKAIHDALTIGWRKNSAGLLECLEYDCKIEKSHAGNNSVSDGLEAGYIRAAIDSQPKPIAAWLHYCYGPSGTIDGVDVREMSLASHLRFGLFLMSTPKKHNRLISLCRIAVLDYRAGVWQSRRLPVEVYATAMGVDASNFARDWRAKLERVEKQIQQFDTDGVGSVSMVVRALRNGCDSAGRVFTPSMALAEIRSA